MTADRSCQVEEEVANSVAASVDRGEGETVTPQDIERVEASSTQFVAYILVLPKILPNLRTKTTGGASYIYT